MTRPSLSTLPTTAGAESPYARKVQVIPAQADSAMNNIDDRQGEVHRVAQAVIMQATDAPPLTLNYKSPLSNGGQYWKNRSRKERWFLQVV